MAGTPLVSGEKPEGEVRTALRIVEVEAGDAQQRIDNFLLRELRGLPRSRVYGLLRRGEVRVNGGRVKPAHRLAAGDQVRIPPVRLRQSEPVATGQRTLHQLTAAILYEDDHFLAINKPAGLAVHGGSGVSGGVIEGLRELRPHSRLELVHRLDRDTSGVLLLARRGPALRAAHEAFVRGHVRKTYRAVVAGRWPRHRHLIEAPLMRFVRGGERLVRVDPEGRSARTEFSVVDARASTTLIEARPATGRTHQIRVHAAHAGHPILGDDKYGADGQRSGRLMLHALRLVVPLEAMDTTLELETPMPADFEGD